jgi:glyoxylase-like metal-dependent hydrolase (beta-lactamase superfamily II)
MSFARLCRLIAIGGIPLLVSSMPILTAAQTSADGIDQEGRDFWWVRGEIYMLVGYGGNITASVGSDGILLVDTGAADSTAAVVAALDRLEERTADGLGILPSDDLQSSDVSTVRFIINSGPGADHTGGNAVFVGSSPDDVSVVAHQNALLRLVNADQRFETLPTYVLGEGEYDVTGGFNGESIRLTHVSAANTDGDVVVYFRESDVISAGDVISMDSFPIIEVDSGGSIDGIIRALNFILNLAIPDSNLEGGTLIIPGHGRLADIADVAYYRDMLVIIRDQIQHGIDSGLSLEEIQALRPALGYEGRFGADEGAWTTRMFVEAIYRSLIQGLQ